MKKITQKITRPNSQTAWYYDSSESKSQAFINYSNYVINNSITMETNLEYDGILTIEVSFFMSAAQAEEFLALAAAADPEISAYNSNNNITLTRTVEDVVE